MISNGVFLYEAHADFPPPTCESLRCLMATHHFTEEPLASAEVWQLPVVVASDITAGKWWGGGGDPGEHQVEKQ